MRWQQSVPFATAVVMAVVLLDGAARRPAPEWPRYVLTEREAFLPGEAQLVAPPPVASADWSSDGRYVLAVRQEEPASLHGGQPPPETAVSLVVWNRRTGRSQEIWKRPAALQHVDRPEWLPGTHAALFQLGWATPPPAALELHNTLFWVDAAAGQVRPIAELQVDAAGGQVRPIAEPQEEYLLVSPTQPLAVLHGLGPSPTLRAIRADGAVGPTLHLKSDSGGVKWSADGRTLYLQNFEAPTAPGQPPVSKFQSVDLQTGALTPLPGAPAVYWPSEPAAPIRLRSAATTLKEANTSQRVLPLWLESTAKSEQPRVLISADSDGGSLAPDLSTVLYLSEGAAWAAPLTRISRQQALTQIRDAQRAVTMSNAKQIGLALAMYAQDYDETFPPAGEGVIGQISPYIKNREVFVSPGDTNPSFVYMLDGPTLGSFKNPATQELGYLPGPDGRAMIYVDGHVVWQSDQPDGPRGLPMPAAGPFR
jgi:hypothetical protein